MANFRDPVLLSGTCAETDLTTSRYHAVKQGTSDFNVVIAAAGEGIGILMNRPNANQQAEIAVVGGGAKVKLGANVTRGAYLVANASGQFITAATAGHTVLARAEVSGVSGDIIPVTVLDFKNS